MKIPINIKIVTKSEMTTSDGGNEPLVIEASAPGMLKRTKDGLVLQYVESEDSGLAGTVTTVSLLDDNIVTVNRSGMLASSCMAFEEGKSHTCVYNTGVEPMTLRIHTQKLNNGITTQGGKMDIFYTIDFVGSVAEKSHLSMSVVPKSFTGKSLS